MREALVDFTLSSSGNRSPYLTYEPYYGLKEKAFSLSADPRFLYKSRAHAPTFDELRAGIRRREGIIVLTGEPGTGKTTLCRSVLASLDRKTFCAFVPDPFVSRDDLLKMLLIEFGVMSVDEVKSGKLRDATRPELSYPLYDFLKSLVPLQAYAVLVIDEAQNLSSQLLEEIRILADLEGPEKLLQLVLVGQPELRDKLKDPTMRQVDQRVSVRCALEPLQRDALQGYIAHRLTAAGSGADRVEFTSEALDLVFAASHGNPRVTNLIVDKALNRGHLDRTWIITPAIVTGALGELGYATPAPALTLDMSFPSTPAIPSKPTLLLPDLDQHNEHVVLEPPTPAVAAAPEERRGRRRLRRAALLVTLGITLAVSGLALNDWELRRQELAQPVALPIVSAPTPPPVSAGPAPVIPPAEFFAPVLP
jgi:general secretion pathway protein A